MTLSARGTQLPSTGHNVIKSFRDFNRDSLSAIRRWRDELGDIFLLNFGVASAVVCAHPDHIAQILTKKKSSFGKGEIHYKMLPKLTGMGLLNADGDLWRRQRRLAQPAFHRRYLEQIFSYMSQVVEEEIDGIARRAREQGRVKWNEEMIDLTMQVVVQSLMGAEIRGESERLHAMVDETLDHVLKLRWSPTYKLLQHVTGKKRSFEAQKRYLDDICNRVIAKRRREGNAGKWDLLAMFMEAVDEDTQAQMDDERLLAELITFFLAGHETSANTLSWAVTLIGHHPEVWEGIRAEADSVFTDGIPGFEKLNEMRYTRAVIDETLRIKPTVWALARRTLEPVELGGYTLPAGMEIMPAVYLAHRHPDFWEEPDTFRPERFVNGLPQDKRKAYIPFGAGPRICIGNNFAYAEMIAVLGRVAQRFDLHVENPDIPGLATITYRPAKPLWVRLTPRDAAAEVA